MEIEKLKSHQELFKSLDMNIIHSKGQHQYRVELSKGNHLLGNIVRRGRPLMFRSLEGVKQTLRLIGAKRAYLIQEEQNQRSGRTRLTL